MFGNYTRNDLMELKILFYDPLGDPMLDPKSNVAEQLALREIVKPASTHTYDMQLFHRRSEFNPIV